MVLVPDLLEDGPGLLGTTTDFPECMEELELPGPDFFLIARRSELSILIIERLSLKAGFSSVSA
jgi:hypothetical protein